MEHPSSSSIRGDEGSMEVVGGGEGVGHKLAASLTIKVSMVVNTIPIFTTKADSSTSTICGRRAICMGTSTAKAVSRVAMSG